MFCIRDRKGVVTREYISYVDNDNVCNPNKLNNYLQIYENANMFVDR